MSLDFIFKHVSKILRKCLKNGCKIENIATFKSARKLSWDETDTRDYEFVIVYIEKGTFKTVTQYKNGGKYNKQNDEYESVSSFAQNWINTIVLPKMLKGAI